MKSECLKHKFRELHQEFVILSINLLLAFFTSEEAR